MKEPSSNRLVASQRLVWPPMTYPDTEDQERVQVTLGEGFWRESRSYSAAQVTSSYLSLLILPKIGLCCPIPSFFFFWPECSGLL